MNTVNDIFRDLCALAPPELQLGYDNAGFLVGRTDAVVSKALLSLDVTSDVIDEAIGYGAQLIISHHPLIWDALKSITDESVQTEKLLRIIENGLAVISMHTNLDIAQGGVNDVLITLLGAKCEGCFEAECCGRCGVLEKPLTLRQFLQLCKEKLQTNGLRYYDAGREVEKIAVLGGSGGGALLDAYKWGCDTFVTADIKYDTFLLAKELGINLIDGDHFCTENPVIFMLKDRLSAAFPDTEFIISSKHCQTASFF